MSGTVQMADLVTAAVGDRVFNHYDRYPVTIESIGDDGWCDTTRDDGSHGPTLNGERLCSVTHAMGKGWLEPSDGREGGAMNAMDNDLATVRRFLSGSGGGRSDVREAFTRLDAACSQSGSLRPAAWDFQRPEDAARIAALEAACEKIQEVVAHHPTHDPIRNALRKVGFDRERDRTSDELHAHHHDLIASHVASHDAAKSKYARNAAGRKAYTMLDGHLRRFHGRTRIVGPPQTLDELTALHVKVHGGEPLCTGCGYPVHGKGCGDVECNHDEVTNPVGS